MEMKDTHIQLGHHTI